MKKYLFFFILFLPLLSVAQHDSIPIPMANGLVTYERTYQLGAGADRNILFARALDWFNHNFQDAGGTIAVADQTNGIIIGTAVFKVVVSDSGNYYWLKPRIQITILDGGYSFKASDYYEKPVETGITNDYSKIEYRWWDYRQGHPWSTEDQRLFQGLHDGTRALMNSLETDMRR